MSRVTKIVLSVVVVLVVVGGAGIWWYLRDDAPAEVSLDAATETLTQATDDADGTTGTEDIAGVWTVDTESGEFDYESATGTFAGFRIEEKLASIGSTTAVGRTGDVTGSMTIDGTTVTEASFEIDLSTITTNESRRDDNVQSALDTDRYPAATFTLTEPIELGDAAANGDPVTVSAKGELTIHGVTRVATFELEAQLVEGTVVVVGSTDVTFADYDVEVPSSAVVLSVEDSGTLELQFLLVKN